MNMGLMIGIDLGTTFTTISYIKNDSDILPDRSLSQCVLDVINYYNYSYDYCELAPVCVKIRQPLENTDIKPELKEKEENSEENDAKLKGQCCLNKADSQNKFESGFIIMPCVRKVIFKVIEHIKEKHHLLLESSKFRISRVLQLFLIERKFKFPIQLLFLSYIEHKKILALQSCYEVYNVQI